MRTVAMHRAMLPARRQLSGQFDTLTSNGRFASPRRPAKGNSSMSVPSASVDAATAATDLPLEQAHANLLSILDGLEAIVYVADIKTHEVLYANRYLRDELGDVQGKICWQAIQNGQNGPCSFCTNAHLYDAQGRPTRVYAWQFRNTRNQRWYDIRDRAIYWVDGRLARLEIAVDVTERKATEERLKSTVKAVSRFSSHMKALHRLTVAEHCDLHGAFNDYLNTGCRIFKLDTGIIGRIDNGQMTIEAITGAEHSIKKGETLALGMTYCERVVKMGTTVALGTKALQHDYADHPAFIHRPLSAFICTPIFVEGHLYGTLSFCAATRQRQGFDRHEREIVEIMAQTVGHLLAADAAAARQRESDAKLALERRLAENTLGSISEAVLRFDPAGRLEYLNPSAARLLQLQPSEALGRSADTLLQHMAPAARDAFLALMNQVRSTDHQACLPDPVIIDGGDEARHVVEMSATPVGLNPEAPQGVVVVVRDVSQTRRLAIELSHQASHDPLTGLINRREFDRRLARLHDELPREGSVHALLYLDLDRFKIVNDTCGHAAGDQLLKQLSQALLARMRHSDSLARLGGDEFGVLLPGCSINDALRIAGEIQRTVETFRFVWGERRFAVGCSVGVVSLDKRFTTAHEALSAADAACYAANERGGNRVCAYAPEDQTFQRHVGDRQWAYRLPHAIEQGEFRIYGQPIVPLGETAHAPKWEILLRMQTNTGELVLPGAFIPAAERYGLMPSIDRWVIEQTLALHATHWPADTLPVFCINLSGASINDDQFLHFLRERIRGHGERARALCFEITETAAISNLAQAASIIAELRELGCRFALDDFGAGMSSFPYLKSLPVDYLKIEGGFVRGIEPASLDHALVEAINGVAHRMGLRTIAEHVENVATLDLLRELGVDFAQGFALGEPVPMALGVPVS